MASFHALRSTPVSVEYTEVPDSDGCPFFAPSSKVEFWRARGLSSITITFNLEPSKPPRPWVSQSEAAQLLMSDVDGLSLHAAEVRISRACERGQVLSEGAGIRRRIEPNSLDVFRLGERERNLARDDEEQLPEV